jgi:hypothetical protein
MHLLPISETGEVGKFLATSVHEKNLLIHHSYDVQFGRMGGTDGRTDGLLFYICVLMYGFWH